jgi:3-oxoacyl-[acyl-carrier-protein] synthase-1
MQEPLLYISHYTMTNALGRGLNASLYALKAAHSGLTACDFADADLQTYIGRVADIDEEPLDGEFARYDCRNNRLAKIGLEQDRFAHAVENLKLHYGSDRIGVFLGTSTSGIRQTEKAYRQRDSETGILPQDFDFARTHNTYSAARFTRRFFQLQGPAAVISTACSSSAKVFATANRYIKMGFCDAAIVGGVDSLCLTTLLGFNALELVSPEVCRPWDTNRKGINIGEAAGFAIVEKAPSSDCSFGLLGYGETSDAYHMSTPHPQGQGAAMAMCSALKKAGLTPEHVDYINLHGTATKTNDSSEDHAVTEVFGTFTPCSSTKGFIGHTLGAAGICESIICFLAMKNGFLPTSLNTMQRDPHLTAQIVTAAEEQEVNITMSNSFGFGGNNCSLVFGKLS